MGVTANGCAGTGPSNYLGVSYNNNNLFFNYIQETTVRVANITNPASLSTLPIGQINVNYTYFDGLGRPIQKIMQGASAASNDVIQPIAYDQLGREVYQYEPYTSSTGTPGSYRPSAIAGGSGYSTSDQYTFYTQTNQNYLYNNFPYVQKSVEASPLSRTTEQSAPGPTWQLGSGHTLRPTYTFNNNITWTTNPATSMQVALYTATINSTRLRTLVRTGNTATYNPNELKVTVTADENWTPSMGRAGTNEEYKDLMGRVVLKRTYNNNNGTIEVLSTYYVYDTDNQLAFVLTPMSNPDGTTAISVATLNNLCYQYQYDERRRMTAKKLPGKGWEYLVYNKADQIVGTQDAVQRGNFQWIITKYDGLGRTIMTGIWTNNGTTVLPDDLETGVYAAPQWDVADPTNTTTGYTIGSYPQTLNTILTINYYDGYTAPNFPSNYVFSGGSNMTTGLLTATKTTVLTTITNANPDMLWAVNYFDPLGRVIQSFQQHYLNGSSKLSVNNYDAISIVYDFTGAVTTQNRKHYNTLSSLYPLALTILNNYDYDQIGRKVNTWETLTNGANGNITADSKILISKLVYNEIGQLLTKNLHSTDGVHFLQSINYSYNERGWLTASSAPFFNMQLQYTTNGNNVSGFTPQYNGNIASQYWTSGGQAAKSYAYTYDNVNRLTNCATSSGFSEQGITYDLNGNIMTLNRNWYGPQIDALKYNYTVNSLPTNALQSVQDTNPDNGGSGYGYGTFAYTYDANGSLKTDAFRGRTVTKSNLLNLPQNNSIAGPPAYTETYYYDANGKKLRRTSTNGTVTNIDYINGIQYGPTMPETLNFIQTEEGMAVPTGPTAIAFDYYYNLSDNLGNVRVTFDSATGAPTQEDDYLPFGMDIPVFNVGTKNYYLYNKKELQPDLSIYDYGARFYDPVITRWTAVDPMAEVSRRWSPYSYVYDNPVRLVDPDGMDVQVPASVPGAGITQVGADGLTDDQWVIVSRPGAPKGLMGMFKQENDQKAQEDNEQQQKQNENTQESQPGGGIYIIIGGKKIYIKDIKTGLTLSLGGLGGTKLVTVRQLSEKEAGKYLQGEIDNLNYFTDNVLNIKFGGGMLLFGKYVASHVATYASAEAIVMSHDMAVQATELQNALNHLDSRGLIEISTVKSTPVVGYYSVIPTTAGTESIQEYYVPGGGLIQTVTDNGN